VALFVSCQETSTLKHEITYSTDYFPLEQGFYRIYSVTTIVIDEPSAIFDTSYIYIKEFNTGIIADASGDSVMRIERVYRDSLHHKWNSLGVWTAKLQDNKAIQTEENVKYVKMIFPLSEYLTWDGHAMNRNDTLKQYPYEVMSIDMAENIGELPFDSVLTIKHRYEESLVMKWDDYEKYALGVGLIYKQTVDLESQNIDPEIPIEERLKTGNSLFMQLIEYGYE
jgi:hypothetical protein